MTSANVREYNIYNIGSDKVVGTHQQHHYCKTHWEDLLKFIPPENYEIMKWWLDEEEEYWEDDKENLRDFLIKRRLIKTELS
jgi:hypothetical protein